MKIGIVTQPLLANYGGLLQNFALQRTLIKLGYSPITLDYQYKKTPKYINYIKQLLKYNMGILKGARSSKPKFPRLRRNSKFNNFVKSHIHLTAPIKEYTMKVCSDYGIEGVIVGSDQVWRPMYNDSIRAMYLDFAQGINIPKISYAASFGVDQWEYDEIQQKECCDLLTKFSGISVREKSGIDLINNYFNQEAELVLDPTLLLTRNEYNEVCKDIPKSTTPYIAIYGLDIDNDSLLILNKFAQKKHLIVKHFSADNSAELTIEEWLATIRDAQYIVTDSFHGTVFSIIYNKNFITLDNPKRGSSRMIDLLAPLALTCKLKSNIDSDSLKELQESIDWTDINHHIKVEGVKSKEFIKKNLAV